MWDSSGGVHTSSRSEYEISATTVKRFYKFRVRPFNDALDAVIAGCVTEYTFDIEAKKFVGTVISFDRTKSYEVKIFVTDDYGIQFAGCECGWQSCYHVGALALHSGFKTPIFSRLPPDDNKALNVTAKDSTTNDNGVNPESESYNQNEIEFVDLNVQQNENFIGEGDTSNNDEGPDPIEQMLVDGNNGVNKNGTEPISMPNKPIWNVHQRSRRRRVRFSRKRNVGGKFLGWKVLPIPLMITPAEWSTTFDPEKNRFNSVYIFKEKFGAQFENISCQLRSKGQGVKANNYRLQFSCVINGCSRFYTFSINQNQIEKKCYAFEVRHIGELKHAELNNWHKDLVK